jgi:hypothetical protein
MKDPEADTLLCDEKRRSRRRLLASLGMGVVGAYVAPTLFSLGQAHADDGRRHGSGRSRPSYSRPSYSRSSASRPSRGGSRPRDGLRYDRRGLESRRRVEEHRRYDDRYRFDDRYRGDDRYRFDDRYRRDDRYPRDETDLVYESLRYLWPGN